MTTTAAAPRTATGTYIGKCSGCAAVVTVPEADRFGKHTCGAWITGTRPIKARLTEHSCGPKCTSALGPTCDCTCGGENHAADHR